MFKKALLLLSTGSIMTMAMADTKAAFDLGSGKFRVLVAEVEGQNIEVKYSKGLDVLLGYDLAKSSDQYFSAEIQTEALNALKDLKQQAKEHGATHFQGVATAAFRLAKNGDALLNLLKQETGIDLRIISQEEEGILGFRSAMAFFPTLDEQKTILWDSGDASFQLVAKKENDYHVYKGPLGKSHLVKFFVEEVKKERYTKGSIISSITPIERDLFIQILQDKINPPEWLLSKLHQEGSKVIACGGGASIFAIPSRYFEAASYSKKQIKEMIEELPTTDLALLGSVCFIYAVMEKCNIHEVAFGEKVGGNALGLLSAELAESI